MKMAKMSEEEEDVEQYSSIYYKINAFKSK